MYFLVLAGNFLMLYLCRLILCKSWKKNEKMFVYHGNIIDGFSVM